MQLSFFPTLKPRESLLQAILLAGFFIKYANGNHHNISSTGADILPNNSENFWNSHNIAGFVITGIGVMLMLAYGIFKCAQKCKAWATVRHPDHPTGYVALADVTIVDGRPTPCSNQWSSSK